MGNIANLYGSPVEANQDEGADGYAPLPPGVMMSLLGGPFFIMLLLKNRKSVEAW